MARGWKILIGVVAALIVLLVLNAVVTGKETKPAEVTVVGGEIVKLPGGDLQAVEGGPSDPRANRGGTIVLLHCFTCAINWWDEMRPQLERKHRVVAIDLLGHGGSEKPESGYTISNQADLVAQVLDQLDVSDATVVGHSLGGAVAVALAQQSPELVNRVVIMDTRSSVHDEGDLGVVARLAFAPVVGEAFWRTKPDFAISKGLEVAFAPGFNVPDAFVDDVNRMTFSAYDDSPADFDDYTGEESLADRAAATGKPLLVIMGAEEQIIDDPRAALASYLEANPDASTKLIAGAGHSPNVERPAETTALVMAFAAEGERQEPASAGHSSNGKGSKKSSGDTAPRHEMQKVLQSRDAVRQRP